MVFVLFFSSRRRHTRCSRDWSSDVCSSDLRFLDWSQRTEHFHFFIANGIRFERNRRLHAHERDELQEMVLDDVPGDSCRVEEIGRASCRDSTLIILTLGLSRVLNRLFTLVS